MNSSQDGLSPVLWELLVPQELAFCLVPPPLSILLLSLRIHDANRARITQLDGNQLETPVKPLMKRRRSRLPRLVM